MAEEKWGAKETGKELKRVANIHTQYGLDKMETVVDKIGDVVEGVFNITKNLSEDAAELVGDALKQTKRTYKGSFDMMRKQTRNLLGVSGKK